MQLFSTMTHLVCPRCRKEYSGANVLSICVCGSTLFVQYDFRTIREVIEKQQFPTKLNSMWRYSLLLPVKSPSFVSTLGEGWTPLVTVPRLSANIGIRTLRIKDETQNPTGSFKDRGLSTTVSKHVELGCNKFVIPTAGNAGVSLSAYAARAGAQARIYMPADTPEAFVRDCSKYGAEVILVSGTISDCRAKMVEEAGDWQDLSTTREPYRLEGKKTLGFEIAEQLDWEMPDAVICPTGGGTALLGIWKAVNELQALGLIGKNKPKLYAAQSENCAPIVRAVEKGQNTVESWRNPRTKALGLRVPSPFADVLILKAIRESNGGAVAVAETDIEVAQKMAAKMEGISMGPEAAVGLAGIRNLVEAGQIDSDEEVVLLNTGTDSRYF